jgi:ureidoglycolate dehydrogenase (NAD+)
MQVAMEKARSAGIAYVGLRNSCHFGAAGVYSYLAAKEGMIGIAMSNDTPTVSVPGSRGAVLGSNPFSYAIPVQNADPIMLDIATSTVAGGKVFTAAVHGEQIPEGWLLDERGMPTTDPLLFPNHASLTPMSGHKGYGIAFLIETLSAILTGAAIAGNMLSWSFADPSLPTNHGASFIVINPDAMVDPQQFQERLRDAIDQIRNAPKRDDCERIYLPGEKEWANRKKALKEGLRLPEENILSLKTLANETGLEWNLCDS